MQIQSAPIISADLRRRFATASNVLVLTGAGVSAESGVPTFRGGGNTAVWKGMPLDIIASARMVERDLPAVREWFDYRREELKTVQPNPAHLAIAGWQQNSFDLTVVTQNIDGLHQKAGSRDVIELHGNIWRARCVSCGMAIELNERRLDQCVSCGDNLRPDVVLFGELLPPGAYERGALAASACDLCFVVGTSALVYPAANLPAIAKSAGAHVVEVNPERTPLSDFCDEVLTGKAGDVLPMFSSPI